jgi:hypothetical protein
MEAIDHFCARTAREIAALATTLVGIDALVFTGGREVIWLHCYGERFADPVQNRPTGPP